MLYDFDTMIPDHPDRLATREIVRCFADGHQNPWNGRQLARRFRDRGMREVRVTAHTVAWPLEFLRACLIGRLAAARRSGVLTLSEGQVQDWWQVLVEADARGQYFCAVTGFLFAGTR